MNLRKKKELLALLKQYKRSNNRRLLQYRDYKRTIIITLYLEDVSKKLKVKKIMKIIEKDLVRKFPNSGVEVKLWKKQHMGAMVQIQVYVGVREDMVKISQYLDKNINRLVGKQADEIDSGTYNTSRTLMAPWHI